MAKDPAFLFYPNDYLGGTMGMTFEEKGAYVELLMLQFNRGHMTSHMIGQTVGQLWDTIKDKFIQDDNGLYYNVRLDEEKIKRQNYTKSRRNNINGNNQHTKKSIAHMTSHMENENENVNEIPNIDTVISYFTENGYTREAAIKAFEYYETSRGEKGKVWKDSKGNTVKNWKMKMRSVWFKPENLFIEDKRPTAMKNGLAF